MTPNQAIQRTAPCVTAPAVAELGVVSLRSHLPKTNTMKTTIRITIACFAVASIAIAATTKTSRLTPHRIAELTAPSEAANPKAYKVEVSGLQRPSPTPTGEIGPISVTLPADKPQAVLECIRELRFPVEFNPPEPAAKDSKFPIIPTTPAAFETINTGWTIRLSARPQGRLIAVYAVADYVEAQLVPGGYGALTGPIYSEKGELLTPNNLDQPRLQTTTTRFHIFALPGEPYEVILYRGAKAEKHTVTITAE